MDVSHDVAKHPSSLHIRLCDSARGNFVYVTHDLKLRTENLLQAKMYRCLRCSVVHTSTFVLVFMFLFHEMRNKKLKVRCLVLQPDFGQIQHGMYAENDTHRACPPNYVRVCGRPSVRAC